MHRLLIAVIAAGLLALAASPARASSSNGFLLAEVHEQSQSGACCFKVGRPLPTHLAFDLLYGFRGTSGGSKVHGIDADVEVGAARRWSSGQAGAAVFTQRNTRDFNAFAAHLTNGTPETFSRGTIALTAAGMVTAGSTVGSGGEAGILRLPAGQSDLAGSTILAVTLIVRKAQITHSAPDSYGNISQQVAWDITWQIWGYQTNLFPIPRAPLAAAPTRPELPHIGGAVALSPKEMLRSRDGLS